MSSVPPEILVQASLGLADALAEDPFYGAISLAAGGDAAQRQAMLGQYFALALAEGFQAGRVDLIDREGSGAAIWTVPDDPVRSASAYAQRECALPDVLGDAGFEIFQQIVAGMERHLRRHQLASARYLSIVGIRPEAQGQGLGARLLAEGLRAADQHVAQCYLETFNARSLPFYERHGFRVREKLVETVTGRDYWLMVRQPFAAAPLG